MCITGSALAMLESQLSYRLHSADTVTVCCDGAPHSQLSPLQPRANAKSPTPYNKEHALVLRHSK
jgi:hypothetical protein